MASSSAPIASSSSSRTAASAYTRVAAVQSWPLLYVEASAAAAATAGTSASAKTTNGALPPNSRWTLVGRRAAAAITRRPVAVDPVTVTMSVRS